MIDLQQLEHNVTLAISELDRTCLTKWPKGSRVGFMRSRLQKTPSSGTVYSCSNGRLQIQCDKLNRRGNKPYKRIHWSMIR